MDKIQASKNRYLKEKVDEFKTRVPKGEKIQIQDYAKTQGMSLNSLVVSVLSILRNKKDNYLALQKFNMLCEEDQEKILKEMEKLVNEQE